MKLNVQHDTAEHEVPFNLVKCDYCGTKLFVRSAGQSTTNMKTLFNIVFFFRLRQKFWGDLFMWWRRRQVNKIINNMDIDVSDIKIVRED